MPASPVFGKVLWYNSLTHLRVNSTICAYRSLMCAISVAHIACQRLPPRWCQSFLSLDEINRVSRAFALLGTEKIRLTGGEPSMRRDFTDIIATIRQNPAIRTLAVTTNGYRLVRDVAQWRDAGLTAINVSVDSLDPRQFHAITGQDKFYQVMQGIDAAFDAGLTKSKSTLF